MYKKFQLNGELTQEQIDFFNDNGFIHFTDFTSREVVDSLIGSMQSIEQGWISENKSKNFGVPVKYGKDVGGNTIVQRFNFASLQSEFIGDFVKTAGIHKLLPLMPEGSRIAEDEMDGVVINHYVNVPGSNYSKMGWHTDSIRELFYFKPVVPMLNVGIYLDDSSDFNGGLRILPGTHTQSVWQLLFKKAYFMNQDADPNEILVQAKAGDMVVHDGRMWHRVAQSPFEGERSRRRVMYIPVICGKRKVKHENSRTPLYHNFLKFIR